MHRDEILRAWKSEAARLCLDDPRLLIAEDTCDIPDSSFPNEQHLVGMPEATGWNEAVVAWTNAIGASNVVVKATVMQSASTATFDTSNTVTAIIKPQSCADIQACLAIANTYRAPIYPISQGKNWGYGSRVPTKDKCTLLDLSQMNRIVDYNEDLAYVTIEPGVTYRQLFLFLREHDSGLMLNTIGSSPDASIVGNALERGLGRGINADSFAAVCQLEVVLPNGNCIHTGYGRFANNVTAPLHRWGIGPSLDGLFSQSNLGIVTRMTLWLTPLAEQTHFITFQLNTHAELGNLLESLRTIRQQMAPHLALGIWNDLRLISTNQQYPWEQTQHTTPLSDDNRKLLRTRWNLGLWNGIGFLFSSSTEEAKATIDQIKRHIEPHVRHFAVFNTIPAEMLSSFTMYLPGIPSNRFTASLYWRKTSFVPQEIDPDRDLCGFIWCDIITPFTKDDIECVIRIVEKITTDYKFEPNIGMPYLDSRCAYITIAVIYDRSLADEDTNARLCVQSIQQEIKQKGYAFSRLDINSMSLLEDTEATYSEFLTLIKQSIDPNNIMAPNRYIPASK